MMKPCMLVVNDMGFESWLLVFFSHWGFSSASTSSANHQSEKPRTLVPGLRSPPCWGRLATACDTLSPQEPASTKDPGGWTSVTNLVDLWNIWTLDKRIAIKRL